MAQSWGSNKVQLGSSDKSNTDRNHIGLLALELTFPHPGSNSEKLRGQILPEGGVILKHSDAHPVAIRSAVSCWHKLGRMLTSGRVEKGPRQTRREAAEEDVERGKSSEGLSSPSQIQDTVFRGQPGIEAAGQAADCPPWQFREPLRTRLAHLGTLLCSPSPACLLQVFEQKVPL